MAFIELTVSYGTKEHKEIYNSERIINVYVTDSGETRMVYDTGGQSTGNIQIKETYIETLKLLKSCK